MINVVAMNGNEQEELTIEDDCKRLLVSEATSKVLYDLLLGVPHMTSYQWLAYPAKYFVCKQIGARIKNKKHIG